MPYFALSTRLTNESPIRTPAWQLKDLLEPCATAHVNALIVNSSIFRKADHFIMHGVTDMDEVPGSVVFFAASLAALTIEVTSIRNQDHE
jgi:hypothetical protein